VAACGIDCQTGYDTCNRRTSVKTPDKCAQT